MNALRTAVWEANCALPQERLAVLTWGNVSGVDRANGILLIKPSGVPYAALRCEDIAAATLDGAPRPGPLRPSSDTPTHRILYRAFPRIGAVCHTHSPYATAFAQAGREIPCLGTTHADHFRGAVPVTRPLTPDETATDYELNTGHSIVERFAALDPEQTPAVLCAGHGPFTWGATPAQAVANAVALEAVARMALATLTLVPTAPPLPQHLQNVHYFRKHGPDARYGQ